MKPAIWMPAALLALAAGCGQPPQTAKPGGGAQISSTAPPREPKPGEEAPAPGVEVKPPAAAPAVRVKIDPPRTAPGWLPAQTRAQEIAANVDRAFGSLKNARGAVNIIIETAGPSGGYLKASADLKFGEDGFALETAIPEEGADLVRIQGDGSRLRMLSSKGEKVYQGRMPADKTPDLDRLSTEGVMRLFAPYTQGRPFWGPLIRDLEKGSKGYSLAVEDREAEVKGGSKRRLVRLVALQKDGPGQVEIVLDAQRWLPVTLKAVGPDEKGREARTLWMVSWGFGGRYEPGEFSLAAKS